MTMKLKLSQLKPNPFKREINGGKLDEDQIKKLMQSLDKLDLMGAIPVIKRTNEYFLVSHHHRVEALKRHFGKNHEVEIVVHNYSDDQLLRGMVVENFTQKMDDFHETIANISAIQKYLGKSKKEEITADDISQWIDDGTGTIISFDKINNMMSIKQNLSPELIKRVKNTQASSADDREDYIQETTAIYLSKIKDHDEQKQLAKAVKASRVVKVREMGKLITKYKSVKETSPEVANEVLAGVRDIADVGFPKIYVPQNPIEDAMMHATNMRDILTSFQNEIPELKKKHISNLTITELLVMYNFMKAWGVGTFAPFFKLIMTEIAKKDGEIDTGMFSFNEKGGSDT